jgi:hypothetical protein
VRGGGPTGHGADCVHALGGIGGAGVVGVVGVSHDDPDATVGASPSPTGSCSTVPAVPEPGADDGAGGGEAASSVSG